MKIKNENEKQSLIGKLEGLKNRKIKIGDRVHFFRINYTKYKSPENARKTIYPNYSNKKLMGCPSLPLLGSRKNISSENLKDNEQYKIVQNGIEDKRKSIYIKVPKFNYSCNLDKNNIFCLKYKKPGKNLKKNAIKNIFESNRNKIDSQHKIPRMIQILENNEKVYDEIFAQYWKYPNIFID